MASGKIKEENMGVMGEKRKYGNIWLGLLLILTLCLGSPGRVMAEKTEVYISDSVSAVLEDGVLEYDDGDSYIGNLTSKYLKKGQGTYVTKKGVTLIGTWSKNKLNTKLGTETFPNGEVYTGGFVNNRRCGKGTYRFSNGDKYTGYWKFDKMHGKGTYTFKNKNYIKGTWVAGKLNGTCSYKKGKYIYKIKVTKGILKKVYSRRKV